MSAFSLSDGGFSGQSVSEPNCCRSVTPDPVCCYRACASCPAPLVVRSRSPSSWNLSCRPQSKTCALIGVPKTCVRPRSYVADPANLPSAFFAVWKRYGCVTGGPSAATRRGAASLGSASSRYAVVPAGPAPRRRRHSGSDRLPRPWAEGRRGHPDTRSVASGRSDPRCLVSRELTLSTPRTQNRLGLEIRQA